MSTSVRDVAEHETKMYSRLCCPDRGEEVRGNVIDYFQLVAGNNVKCCFLASALQAVYCILACHVCRESERALRLRRL